MFSPGHKRQVVEALVKRSRSTFADAAKAPDAWLGKLKEALRRCTREYPEWGYQKITRLLQKEGWEVGSRMKWKDTGNPNHR